MIYSKEIPAHPLQIWLSDMRHSLDLIEGYENISTSDLRLEFEGARRMLRFGWPLISLLKNQEAPSAMSPTFPRDAIIHQDLTEQEQTKRFHEFCILARQRIIRACFRQSEHGLRHPARSMVHLSGFHKIPTRKPVTYAELLSLFIRAGNLSNRSHLVMNPAGWSSFKIAPKLFAKSVCLLTLSPHDMTEIPGLSFLLARLEEALGLYPLHSITWQGKPLPPARPEI